MTISRKLSVVFAAVLSASAASAQLKLPKGPQPGPAPSVEAPARASVAPVTSDAADKEAAGKLAAAGWLTLLDRRDWGTAWEASAGMFRNSVPLASWMDNIPAVRAPLGALVERAPADSVYRTELAGRPNGEYVSVIFASRFDNKEVQEIVTTVREADGRWRVTGYSTR